MLFRSNVQAGQGFNPLQLDATVAHSGFSRGNERWRKKLLPLDLTIVNTCALSNLEKGGQAINIHCHGDHQAKDHQVSRHGLRYLNLPSAGSVDV